MPAGRSWPASVVSRVVTRRHEIWLDWKRRTSSTALGISDGSATELGPGVAARQQAREAVADEVGHRLVAGERQAVDDRLDLVVGDVVGMGVVGVEQLGGEVVGAVVALVGGELAAVAPVAEHPLGDLDLLGAGRVAPRERLAVTAPVLEQVVVLLGEPDEAEHRLAGQRVRQRGDELGRRPGVEHGVDQLVGAPDDERLERLQPSPREALPRVHPDPRVVGLGEVGHHGNGIEVGDGEDSAASSDSGYTGSWTFTEA